jgi:amino acid transporter
MASTAVDLEGAGGLKETRGAGAVEKDVVDGGNGSPDTISMQSLSGDHTHRTLKSRHIQLIGEF